MTFQQLDAFLTERHPPSRRTLGVSPGGAAAELGVSRQYIHEAIQRGYLDAIKVTGPDGKVLVHLVTNESLRAFKAKRKAATT